MAQRSKTLSILKKITALEAKLNLDAVRQGSALPPNTKPVRKGLLQLMHYTYLLYCMTQQREYAEKARYCMALAEELQKKELAENPPRTRRELEALERERNELLLVDGHTRAWSMALHYYERGSKELCQMMVTAMDELLQRRAGESVLYSSGRPQDSLTLEQELARLELCYRDSFYFLCVYDYCVGRLADEVKISEYRLLVQEHERIIRNGLPDKVGEALSRLGEPELVHLPVTPQESLLALAFDRAVEELGGEPKAMNDFVTLVIQTDVACKRYLEDAQSVAKEKV